MERFGIHAVMNSGAIKFGGKYILVARVESADRKSFFAVAESPNGVDNFRFWPNPVTMPEYGEPATNVYDMRLTAHEDGWIYGIFCVERKDKEHPDDLSAAVASAGVARTKDLITWERLPDIVSSHQQPMLSYILSSWMGNMPCTPALRTDLSTLEAARESAGHWLTAWSMR